MHTVVLATKPTCLYHPSFPTRRSSDLRVRSIKDDRRLAGLLQPRKTPHIDDQIAIAEEGAPLRHSHFRCAPPPPPPPRRAPAGPTQNTPPRLRLTPISQQYNHHTTSHY